MASKTSHEWQRFFDKAVRFFDRLCSGHQNVPSEFLSYKDLLAEFAWEGASANLPGSSDEIFRAGSLVFLFVEKVPFGRHAALLLRYDGSEEHLLVATQPIGEKICAIGDLDTLATMITRETATYLLRQTAASSRETLLVHRLCAAHMTDG